MIDIHPYHSADQSALLQLMIELQGFISPLDPLHRLKTTEDLRIYPRRMLCAEYRNACVLREVRIQRSVY